MVLICLALAPVSSVPTSNYRGFFLHIPYTTASINRIWSFTFFPAYTRTPMVEFERYSIVLKLGLCVVLEIIRVGQFVTALAKSSVTTREHNHKQTYTRDAHFDASETLKCPQVVSTSSFTCLHLSLVNILASDHRALACVRLYMYSDLPIEELRTDHTDSHKFQGCVFIDRL